ncbi:diacylglycerol kinase family protein [Syntrophomonas palmitatica]|uniref:diacylglycerol kinase family protein n=1 Tax=Syntrophomonas palmitatica TaxID=402877 RepID=UPI0006D0BB50|nr:diacylglycerol kinase family protein [Syntrophomonas palmitatica]
MGSGNLGESFGHAVSGMVQAFVSQRNMKIHGLAALISVSGGFLFRLNRLEWGMLILTIFFVLVSETINTSVEKTVDLVTLEYHPLAKAAKNLAAGAVLLSAINAVIMGFIIFGPHIF